MTIKAFRETVSLVKYHHPNDIIYLILQSGARINISNSTSSERCGIVFIFSISFTTPPPLPPSLPPSLFPLLPPSLPPSLLLSLPPSLPPSSLSLPPSADWFKLTALKKA